MIDARTKLLGIIGHPISHSLSPALQNFALKELGLNYCYHAFDVKPEYLGSAMESLKFLNFRGLNVTLPHKQKVIRFLDEISEEVKALGAVNTILFQENKILGFNTDMLGFARSLSAYREQIQGKIAVLLGAGGSAKAVAYALIKMEVSEIVILNRTLQNAEQMASQFKENTTFKNILAAQLDKSNVENYLKKTAILINTTPLGMDPDVNSCPLGDKLVLPSELIVYDLIYNPLKTKLLKIAEKSGCHSLNGLDMLIYQGLESLKIWTGETLDDKKSIRKLRQFLIERMKTNE